MPTTLERTTVTLTPPVRSMIDFAAGQWPELHTSRELVLRLMQEGEASLKRKELEAAYEQAYDEWQGSEDERLWNNTVNDGLGDEAW